MAGIPGHATLVRASDGGAGALGGACIPSRAPVARLSAGLRAPVRPAGHLRIAGRMVADRQAVGPSDVQTNFTPEQLRDPATARSNQILRTCVHCGFCTATCPTYQVLGDELDSPRGRIYLIKDMLETGRPADEKTVKHIDRCLSCLACMTTCPSGVHYMHLVDHARAYIEETYRRPPMERALRWALAKVLPYPGRFRLAIRAARVGRPFAGLMPKQVRAMLEFAPRALPPPSPMDDPQVFPAEGPRRKRVALLTGCAQRALNTDINAATIRLLDPARLRGGDRRGRGMLRGADPSHGQGAREPRGGGEEHPGLDARGGRGGARRGGDQHLGLRDDGEGLRPHVRGRSAGRRRGAGGGAGAGPDGADGGARARRAGRGAGAAGRLSCRLLAAARPAGADAAQGAAQGRGLRGGGAARQPSLLRLGGDLQPAAAGDLAASSGRARWRRWRSGRRR